MPVGFTLSHRLARGFWIVGSAAALSACAGESPTKPGDSNPVSSVTVSPGTAELDVSATLQLAAELRDSLGTTLSGRSVSWSSDIEAIATVSVYGVVRGADTGTATITAFSEGRSASATVKVKRNAHAGYYASPSGSSGGDGSRARPWDLPT
ncbi:MAG TPA: Ig-like domain-containing protein, partial [Gemmatimonadales bacterium]|nr:Ig-like domain-containing protein [Gemmatimonadales bacterium]